MIKSPSPSMFRPRRPVDQRALRENKALVEEINRRGVLRGAVSLGALALLTGCDVSEHATVQRMLRAVSSWNHRVQAAIFRPAHLAPTYTEAEVLKPPRFNAYYEVEDVRPVDGATWRLELAGLVADGEVHQLLQELPLRGLARRGAPQEEEERPSPQDGQQQGGEHALRYPRRGGGVWGGYSRAPRLCQTRATTTASSSMRYRRT